MKLKDALILGKTCGLKTVGESFANVDFHAFNLFDYDKVFIELCELDREIEKLGAKDKDSIDSWLLKLKG